MERKVDGLCSLPACLFYSSFFSFLSKSRELDRASTLTGKGIAFSTLHQALEDLGLALDGTLQFQIELLS